MFRSSEFFSEGFFLGVRPKYLFVGLWLQKGDTLYLLQKSLTALWFSRKALELPLAPVEKFGFSFWSFILK